MKEDINTDKQFLGTVFDRQVRIQDWNQKLIASHTALCLGVGGLGSIVVMNLLRLGIKKIILVDYDKVDNHNLNRQIMFSAKDVGQSKVKSCIKNTEFHNIGNTQLVGFQGCVLENWQKIIEFAKQSNIIFNMIDYGDWFDLACQSLALKLNIPMIQGGTFGVTMTVDYYSPMAKPCALCLNPMQNNQFIQKILPCNILQINSLKFLPKNNNPVGRSFVGVCAICAQYMVCMYLNSFLFNDRKHAPTQRLIFYTTSFQMVNFPLQPQKNCIFCGDNDKSDDATVVKTNQQQFQASLKQETKTQISTQNISQLNQTNQTTKQKSTNEKAQQSNKQTSI